ncbi:MAG: DoxX family protein [Candidatus Levybacteria bacterium RIFCSPLOWO2_01_FULL_38_21]|nr:MAG: DoxX family protein [Candidatus Levybacteria bacterium RIFCSPLOWO2_01_FULL_38_21]
MDKNEVAVTHIPEPKLSRLLFADTRFSLVWLAIRLYVGWIWLQAGIEKVQSPVWTGTKSGVALTGFVTGALQKTLGLHPDVQGWYATFLKDFVLPNSSLFSYLVAYGEVLVGIALILGFLTGIAAFFGGFMNMSFLLAGTVSTNPILFLLELLLILAWRVAGWWGIDRFILPLLGGHPKKKK